MPKCIDCKYASRFQHPGPPPESNSFWGVPKSVMEMYNLSMELYNNGLVCNRYPKTQPVNKSYWCGEFKDRYDDETK